MHEVLVNSLGGLSLPRKSVVRLTDRPNMTLDVYGVKTAIQQQIHNTLSITDQRCALHQFSGIISMCQSSRFVKLWGMLFSLSPQNFRVCSC